MNFHTRYSPPTSPSLECPEQSLTRQEFKSESDINGIMSRYRDTGVLVDPLTVNSERRPIYGDFSTLPDYQDCLQVVIDAHNKFDSLPSSIRERFANNPALLLNFLRDPANRDEAVKLGLVERRAVGDSPARELKRENQQLVNPAGEKPPSADPGAAE